MGSVAEAAGGLVLPASGWDVRIGQGSRWRPALEMHTTDGLIDVAVAGGLGQAMLRGALRGRTEKRSWALAWGQLPEGWRNAPLTVQFRAGRTTREAEATVLADAFWVAEAEGVYRSVIVSAGLASRSVRLHRYVQTSRQS